MAKTIGAIACRGLNCGKEVAVSETPSGHLNLRCGFCGFSPYAPAGSKSKREILAAMTPMDDEAPATPPAAKPESKPAPQPRGGFDISQLGE